MTAPHLVPAAMNLLALVAEPRPSESVMAPPLTPALIVGLCVVAGLATWLALPGKREIAIRRVGGLILTAVGLILAALMVRWTVDLGGMSVYFWLFSAVALFASVRVITHTKPVYSALYFVLTVFATGGLFVLLWAEFIAAALVLIYAGAILITYVFVIMLASESLSVGDDSSKHVSEYDAISRDPFWASLTGFAVMGLLIFLVFDKSMGMRSGSDQAVVIRPVQAEHVLVSSDALANTKNASSDVSTSGAGSIQSEVDIFIPGPTVTQDGPDLGSAQMLGQELLDHQALNVQLAAVILTVAMVGAITLARRRVIVAQPAAGHDMVSTPATPVDDNPHSIAVYGTDNPRHKAYPEN